jgi:FimV-like protein
MKAKQNRNLLPAIAAISGGLAALPAAAIELGDMSVQSSLGQPLRASIAYALAPNEQLFDFCVSLSQGRMDSGMPAIRTASVSVADGVISLTGKTPIKEPLVTARVIIDCPYTAHISREYTLFIDPAGTAEAAQAIAPAPIAAPAPVAQPAARQRPVTRRPAAALESIENAARYRVQPGDTLSVIAQRIENRSVGLWDAVNAIFEANPDAFINNDLNRLKTGSWLLIPDFGASVEQTVAETQAVDVMEPVPVAASPIATDVATQDEAPPLENTIPAAATLAPAESVPAETTVILDAQLEAPVASSTSPNVPTATLAPTETLPVAASETRSWGWLLWLGGGGLALIIGLLIFGRRGRDNLDSTPVSAAVTPQRRATDTARIEVTEHDIEDDSPTHENLALDADLVIGTGLSAGTDVEVNEDFAFATTSVLDLELPEEAAEADDRPETDIIPPLNIEAEANSILESEVLPEDDDYDMSVIMDATKMPQPDDVTERDLKAIAVDDEDETLIADSYTVSKEVDFDILEQDYEDEMTATQALNAEISKAAAELAERMEYIDESDATAAMPMASVTELDITAQLPAQNDDSAATVNMEADDSTVEMNATRHDEDETMEIESGKVDTKAG